MNAKAKGTRAEHRSRALLEAVGYRVTRAAASLGEWDLIGIGPADAVLVQVKVGRWPGRAEMEALERFPAPVGFRKVAHRWRAYKRLPDVREIL